MIQRSSTADKISIDRDVFDEMYDAKNPLPDRQDYAALERYYKDKKRVYLQVQKTMNEKYREKFLKYMSKFAETGQSEVDREDEWANIRLGEKTRAGLETLYNDYRASMAAKKREVTCNTVDEYLKQLVLHLIYSDLLNEQDDPGEPGGDLAVDDSETYLDYIRQAMESSEHSGMQDSLSVHRSTQNVLDRLRDITFLETYDQTVNYLLNLIGSHKYRAYLASREKTGNAPDYFRQPRAQTGDSPAGGEDNLQEIRKIRDVDDFIIDYLRLLKRKESKKL